MKNRSKKELSLSTFPHNSVFNYFLPPKLTLNKIFCPHIELLSRARPWSMKLPTTLNATPTPAATKRKGKWIPHPTCPNNNPTMATTRIYVLLFVLSAALAEDLKLKYKPSNRPVRLFTEEELERYDGSEVNFYYSLTHNRECSCWRVSVMYVFVFKDPCNMR